MSTDFAVVTTAQDAAPYIRQGWKALKVAPGHIWCGAPDFGKTDTDETADEIAVRDAKKHGITSRAQWKRFYNNAKNYTRCL